MQLPAAQMNESKGHKTEKQTLLTWEIEFPLLTHPHIVSAWIKAMGATYVICMVILGTVFAGSGEIEVLPRLALFFLGVVAGVVLLGFLIMLVFFGNRSCAKFSLSDSGVHYESLDKRATRLSRAAVLAGGLLGSPATAGAGLLSISQEKIGLKWETVHAAKYDDRHHTIRLRNQYRDLLHLYCTPQIYGEARELIKEKLAQKREHQMDPQARSPLPGALLSTLMVVLSCLPLFALVEIAKLHLMVPLLIMVFSLAMIWMIPLFAWVVLPLAGYIPVFLLWTLSQVHEFKLVSTYSYRRFELLDAGEWIIVGLAAAGLSYLSWISIQSLKGRYVPVLMRDQQGMT
jgi:MFS family permease